MSYGDYDWQERAREEDERRAQHIERYTKALGEAMKIGGAKQARMGITHGSFEFELTLLDPEGIGHINLTKKGF